MFSAHPRRIYTHSVFITNKNARDTADKLELKWIFFPRHNIYQGHLSVYLPRKDGQLYKTTKARQVEKNDTEKNPQTIIQGVVS